MNSPFIDIEGQGADPQRDARNLLARSAALSALETLPAPDDVDTVGYRSAGNTLVIGHGAEALAWADRLAAVVPVTVLLLDPEAPAPALRLYTVVRARALVLSGWLGSYQATWQAPERAPEHARFDLVFDLGASPQITAHQRPYGYFAPGPDEAARTAAAADLLDMVGDFEKPKYFRYKERLCAHSRNRRTGCTACIDICSAQAIEGAGDLVKVNPYLCAGCGACSTVCPTGAMGYAYPGVDDMGRRVKTLLNAYAEAGGSDPVLLFHGTPGAALLVGMERAGQSLPARVLPIGLHHAASTGIDVWLAALAQGAAGIAVLTTSEEAPQYVTALQQQMEIVQDVMAGLGYGGAHVQLLRASTPQELALALGHAPRGSGPAKRAGFNVAPDKRTTLDYALDHLVRQAPLQPDTIALAPGSPFGSLQVNQASCSLCMSCVGACPAGALQDGQNAPQLRFIEKNCVQCGLCADTCPEDAITLVPRLSLREERKQPVVLNETQPFHCIRCSKPFGTVRMIEGMLAKLAGHPAFAGNLERMRMCGDCRVIDMMSPQDEVTIGQVREVKRH